MPIFEFVCGGCGRQFEEIMSFAQLEAGEASCPHCGSKRVQRSMSTFAASSGTPAGGSLGGGCGGGGGGFG